MTTTRPMDRTRDLARRAARRVLGALWEVSLLIDQAVGWRCWRCEAGKRKPMPDLGPLGKLDCRCLPCQAERVAA